MCKGTCSCNTGCEFDPVYDSQDEAGGFQVDCVGCCSCSGEEASESIVGPCVVVSKEQVREMLDLLKKYDEDCNEAESAYHNKIDGLTEELEKALFSVVGD